MNSFHHQAVKTPGRRSRRVGAAQADGVVEGIEMPADRRFVVGVQWHPESFWDQPPGFQPLFEALVHAANGRSR